MFGPFFNLARDAALLSLEAQAVIGLRLGQMALGDPRAGIEARRMVSEKVTAAIEAPATLAMGGSAHQVIRGYRRHVKANVRRLTR
jgi:hypothetical protein